MNARAWFEAVVDDSVVAPRLEMLLPTGARPRQLRVKTLLLGMLLAQGDGRAAHLTRVHRALVELPRAQRRALGVEVAWTSGWHLLTYRQVERTFALLVAALEKEIPDGTPSETLSEVLDALMEASVPHEFRERTRALAVDWSDHESFARPPSSRGGDCADAEASWGRRKSDQPGRKDELFFGYELQAATMVREEGGPDVPELVRRILLTSCSIDPPAAFAAVLARLATSGVALGDVLADSGYAHRVAERWALPLRALGATIVTDLHPQDRGPRGTFSGAVVANGNLYCPSTPAALLALGPLARGASEKETAAHDAASAELARYKLGRLSADDADGYHRVACPAVTGKVRCSLRASSMALSFTRPEVLAPPEVPPPCCCQRTLTVPVSVAAKTAQKHDYPSRAHRLSYSRRTAVERTFSTTKDRASNDMTRGWCRVTGVTAISLFTLTCFVARNKRILDSFETKEKEDERRHLAGLPPKTRRRRRRTINDLVSANSLSSPT
jgi:hypothetical protein